MCGIFAYFSSLKLNVDIKKELEIYSNKIKHRGPDMTRNKLVLDDTGMLVFHRLSIVDSSEKGMQPFYNNGYYSICNGEIYNHMLLESTYDIKLISKSDCEVIGPLVKKVGIKKTCEILNGVFAFVVVDSEGNIIIARDPFGVRSLYVGTNTYGDLCVSSELKGIPKGFEIKPFSPGTYSIYKKYNNRYIEIKQENVR
jgi:asparagine synthase (glutamine-hydrolysing)